MKFVKSKILEFVFLDNQNPTRMIDPENEKNLKILLQRETTTTAMILNWNASQIQRVWGLKQQFFIQMNKFTIGNPLAQEQAPGGPTESDLNKSMHEIGSFRVQTQVCHE
jgi:hypothetical protein